MRVAGIDIGSRTTKLVLLEDDRPPVVRVADTTYDPMEVCRRLLRGVRHDRLVATGYGRHLFAQHWGVTEVISEIKAVALGVRATCPSCRTVIDIGGQDTKVVALDGHGRVLKFAMNDRCAAGTGRFLEVMATALSYAPHEFIEAARAADRPRKLSSMCTVFAESEVISLVARAVPREEIALGIHLSVAQRTAALATGIPVEPDVVFAGGGALNTCLRSILADELGRTVQVPEHPQTAAALGCALYGQNGGNHDPSGARPAGGS
jgi:predicted CoA-substrate-specific enzyme activase